MKARNATAYYRGMPTAELRRLARRQMWQRHRKWLIAAIVVLACVTGYTTAMREGYRLCAVRWCVSNANVQAKPSVMYVPYLFEIGGSNADE